MNLIKEIKKLEKMPVSLVIEKKLKEFKKLGKKDDNMWFSELCFCILTANSKAHTALNIQKELGINGFLKKPEKRIAECIRKNKHRFHNTKAKFIVSARKHKDIKTILKKEKYPRKWLIENIKGLGFKESSHFLRNIGFNNYAILDRHILNLMKENKLINEKPKSLNKNNYLKIEKKLDILSKKLKFNQAKLDLYLWYMKTKKVLK